MIAPLKSPLAAEQRVVMHDVSWQQYDALVSGAPQRSVRIAFNQGVMELTSRSRLHESYAYLIGRLIEAFADARDIEIAGVKSTTFRREDLHRGFEPDESYYIANAPLVRELTEIDLTLHPGPDLVIEVDISRSSMSKFEIYAAFRVREVWLHDSESLRLFALNDSGKYEEIASSRVLPDFPLAELPDWLDRIQEQGQTKALRAFRKQEEQRAQ